MVYVPEMPRVDVTGALSSGYELGSAFRQRKAKNALARIYAGDESALPELMQLDPEAGRQVETQIGARQFVSPATQEQAGPVRPGIDASLEAQPAKVDVEGLTGYLASRGDSGALKALTEKMKPQDAAKFGFSKERGINPATGKEEFFITDDAGNPRFLGVAPPKEVPKIEQPKPQMVQGADGKVYWLNPGEQLPEGVTTKAGSQPVATEDERKAAGWYNQMNKGLADMTAVRAASPEAAKPGVIESLPDYLVPDAIANASMSPERQQFRQAASAFAEGALRAATGAGVTESEAKQKIRELTPQWGDSDAVIEQKRQSLYMYLESVGARAGRALQQQGSAPSAPTAAPTAPQPQQLTPYQQYVREFNAAKAKGDRAKMKWLTEQAVARGIAKNVR